ncbi:MAG: tetratricopeptide repeat protein [bacterium]
MRDASDTTKVKSIILLLFFFSGISGLIYAVASVRILRYSITTIFAIYFTGLALGSFISGRFIDDRPDLFKTYGILQGILGCSCLFLPYFIRIATHQLNFFVCALLLMVPLALIGASWPMLIKFFVKKASIAGWAIGQYYGIHLLGSFLGALLTGFLLLPYLGINKSVYLAGTLNLLIGITSLSVHTYYSLSRASLPEGKTEVNKSLYRFKGILLGGYALSSCATMLFQLSWLKTLIISMDLSVWSFFLIVSTVLLGVTLGSISLSIFIDKKDNPVMFFAIVELLLSLYCFIIIPLLDWFSLFAAESGPSLPLPHIIIFFFLLFIVSMPALLTGFSFPLVSKIYMDTLQKVGKSTASVYSVYTLGCLIGVLVWRLLAHTGIGLVRMSLVAICIHLIIGSLFFLISSPFSLKYRASLSLAALIVCYILFQPSLIHNLTNSNALEKEEKVLFTKEGAMAYAEVKEYHEKISVHIDGKSISSKSLLAHIPMVLHRNPTQVLLLGLGNGVTLHSVKEYRPDSIDCVESANELIEATLYYQRIEHPTLNDPKQHIINRDIREYLTFTKNMYDVIISHPASRWPATAQEFLTFEFFQLCSQRLQPDGIIVINLSTRGIKEEQFKSILYTCAHVFPFLSLWEVDLPHNYCLLGSLQKFAWNETALHSKSLAHFFMDERAIASFCSDSALFTDDYSLGRSLYNYKDKGHNKDTTLLRALHTLRGSGIDDLISGGMDNTLHKEVHHFIEAKKYTTKAFIDLVEGRPKEKALEKLKQALQLNPDDDKAKELYIETLLSQAQDYTAHQHYDLAIVNYLEILNVDSQQYEARYQLAELYYTTGFIDQAIIEYEKLIRVAQEHEEAHCHLGRAYLNKGWLDRSSVQFERALAINPDYPEPYFFLGTVYFKKGLLPKSLAKYEEALSLKSDYADARYNLGLVYLQQGLIDEAISEWEKVIKLRPDDVNSRYNLAVAYYNYGKIKHAVTHLENILKIKPTMYQAQSLLHLVNQMRDE